MQDFPHHYPVRKSTIDFIHADQDFQSLGFERPALPNINLLLGNNGSGKSALLMAIALAALGPAVRSSGIYAYRLVRLEPSANADTTSEAVIGATFTAHEQDHSPVQRIESRVSIRRRGDLEELDWTHGDDKLWHPNLQ